MGRLDRPWCARRPLTGCLESLPDCMKTIQKSVLLWHSAHEMFALVTDVQHYPQFLPWCDHSEVVERDEHGMVAKVGMAISGIRQSFTTRNRHVDDRQVLMELVDGPFSHLEGRWDFTPLGDGSRKNQPGDLCVDVVEGLPHCMDLVTPEEVCREVERFLPLWGI